MRMLDFPPVVGRVGMGLLISYYSSPPANMHGPFPPTCRRGGDFPPNCGVKGPDASEHAAFADGPRASSHGDDIRDFLAACFFLDFLPTDFSSAFAKASDSPTPVTKLGVNEALAGGVHFFVSTFCWEDLGGGDGVADCSCSSGWLSVLEDSTDAIRW